MEHLTTKEARTLEAIEMIDEIKTLTDEEFIEFKGLWEMLLIQENNRRFGKYERPEPRKSY